MALKSDLISRVDIKAKALLVGLGFKRVIIGVEEVYEYKGKYHKLNFVAGLGGFVIECATSLDEARKNLYEDSDILQVSAGEEELLKQLQHLIVEYYL